MPKSEQALLEERRERLQILKQLKDAQFDSSEDCEREQPWVEPMRDLVEAAIEWRRIAKSTRHGQKRGSRLASSTAALQRLDTAVAAYERARRD